ncbi:hypothetical protein BASA61_000470 [Batrachochytrium salamandrivorans]|nr:hypothetical protein BASA61_000470 [Batrachochytrium salamandrivorans]
MFDAVKDRSGPMTALTVGFEAQPLQLRILHLSVYTFVFTAQPLQLRILHLSVYTFVFTAQPLQLCIYILVYIPLHLQLLMDNNFVSTTLQLPISTAWRRFDPNPQPTQRSQLSRI